MPPVTVRISKTDPTPTGARRTVAIVDEDERPVADEPVVFIEPLLDNHRTPGKTDQLGECTYEQPHENDGHLKAPRPFRVEVKGMAYPVE